MSASKPLSVPTSPPIAKDWAQKPFEASSVDSSDDDDDVPLRDKRRRDGIPSGIENSFHRATSGGGLVSIGGSGSQSKLYVAIASAVLI
jgi:hypothetical protein